MTQPPSDSWLSLLDWRRQVADLYASVRQQRATDPQAAHALWTACRNELFGGHPQSPLPPESRATFTGLPVWPYNHDLEHLT